MSTNKEIAGQFLKKYGMHSSSVDVDATLSAFQADMEAGLSGQPSSLEMIPTFVETEGQLPTNKPVIVLDAGGTNLRVCTVTFDENGQATISHFSKHPMPGIARPLSKQEFYETIYQYLLPVIDKADGIGFCFSYPTEISPSKDGKLLYWTKEVKVPEVVGEYIGENLLALLEQKGHPRKKIVLLNDTVATLLAGKAVGQVRCCEDYIGFILGTGTNTAYVEKNRNITKRSDLDLDKSQVINVESGSFAQLRRGTIDLDFNESTANPDTHVFEKMISGAYLGPLCLAMLKTAAADGLLSDAVAELVCGWDSLSTKDMDDFLGHPFREEGPFATAIIGDADRELIMHLCSGIVARAALLTAINISAAVLKCGGGTNPLYPVCINVDGSTYHKTNGFELMVEGHLRTLLLEKGIYYQTIQVDNAPVIGAAIAGLIG